MLDLFTSGLISLSLQQFKIEIKNTEPQNLIAWQGLPWITSNEAIDTQTTEIINDYLNTLKSQGLDPNNQGIWLSTENNILLDHQGTKLISGASLTKAATSLAALNTWKLDHRFNTTFNASQQPINGVINGDLIVQSTGDPLFVWEDAIAIANKLNKLGIKEVKGNLVIVGNFYMNFQQSPEQSGMLLKQGLAGKNLPAEILAKMKDSNLLKTPIAKLPNQKLPQVNITGNVTFSNNPPTNLVPLIAHQSLPLYRILREMNIYSNNEIAQIITNSLGGHEKIMEIAASQANFPREEIKLMNGSGLGVDNQLSPRASSQIFRKLSQIMQNNNLNIGDLFPVSGVDKLGTMLERKMPTDTVIKTGTLNTVSALTGVLPTKGRGLVWFTIVNRGTDITKLRQQQDQLLQSLVKVWGNNPSPVIAINRRDRQSAYLGDPQRSNLLLNR